MIRIKMAVAALLGAAALGAWPTAGQKAPTFKLYNYDTKDSTDMADHFGKEVVLLISGNFC